MPRLTIDAPEKERRNTDQVSEEPAFVDDHEIQQAILDICSGGDLCAESPLFRIRECQDKRRRLRRPAVDVDRVFDRLVAKKIARARREIRKQPPVTHARGDKGGDVRVDPDARHIEEQAIAELCRIDEPRLRP